MSVLTSACSWLLTPASLLEPVEPHSVFQVSIILFEHNGTSVLERSDPSVFLERGLFIPLLIFLAGKFCLLPRFELIYFSQKGVFHALQLTFSFPTCCFKELGSASPKPLLRFG